MTRTPTIRTFGFVLLTLAAASAGACSKKPAPMVVEDAAPPPPAASMPEVTELAPLVEDAGMDAEVDSGAKRASGPGYNTNQVRIKQCCNAMRTQAKQLGASPEANQLTAFAVQCDAWAAQVGSQGTAPEFAQMRQLLKSIKLPAACAF